MRKSLSPTCPDEHPARKRKQSFVAFSQVNPSRNFLPGRRRDQTEAIAALAMLRRVTESAPGLLYVYDFAAGAIRSLNRGYLDYVPAAESAGPAEAFLARVHPEDIQALLRHRCACRGLQDGEVAEITFRIRHRDGGEHWLSSRDTPLSRSAEGRITEVLCAAQDVTELREATTRLQRLTRSVMTMQDDERRRIARDLHDSTAQNLLAAALTLKTHQDRVGTSADLRDALDLIEGSQREIRTLSYLLYPPLLEEMGLRAALAWYSDGFTKRTGIPLRLEMPDPAAGKIRLPLTLEAETAMFRVAQEALTNAYRYASASIVVIALTLTDAAGAGSLVRLRISDDGRGMGPERNTAGRLPGLGLTSMDERMRAVGGSLAVRSLAGRGTTIEATCPAAAACADPDFGHPKAGGQRPRPSTVSEHRVGPSGDRRSGWVMAPGR